MSFFEQLHAKPEPQEHFVQFYGADHRVLTRNASHFLWEGLKRGDGILVIATAEHREAFTGHLKILGADPEAAMREGRLLFLDAGETLAHFMIDGQPDWIHFENTVRAAMRQVQPLAEQKGLRAYAGMVGALWEARQFSAAIRLEGFWNRLLKSIHFELLCSCPIDIFGAEFEMTAIDGLLCAHTHLVPAGNNGDLESALNRAMDDVLGPRVDELRALMKANYRPSWAVLPRAEAIILWLRANLPDEAEKILFQARRYYQSERRFRALIENCSDAISLLDPHGKVLYASASTTGVLGYLPEELVDRNAFELIHPDDREHVSRALEEVLAKPRFPIQIEARVRQKDGHWCWIESTTANLLDEPDVWAIISNSRDISERKAAAESIQRSKDELRALAASLFRAQEEERRRVARELHDDLSQTVALLEIETQTIEQQLPETSHLRRDLREMRNRTMALSESLCRIAHQLHPSILDHLGLPAALNALTEDLGKRHKLAIHISTSAMPDSIPPDVAGCLYRITQEAIRNTVKHGNATKIKIRLSCSASGLELSIDDDGVGFDPLLERRDSCLGLISMEERARLLGGAFTLRSQIGKGTSIKVFVPFECTCRASAVSTSA